MGGPLSSGTVRKDRRLEKLFLPAFPSLLLLLLEAFLSSAAYGLWRCEKSLMRVPET